MFYVYAHINPITLKPFYVGKGKGDRANSTLGRNPFWHNTVNKYGFGVLKLVDGLNNEQACEIEKQYIKKYGLRIEGGSLVNLTYGGSGGNTITENNRDEHRKNSGLAKLGSKNPNFGKSTWILGKHLSDEQKQQQF